MDARAAGRDVRRHPVRHPSSRPSPLLTLSLCLPSLTTGQGGKGSAQRVHGSVVAFDDVHEL